MFCIRKNLKYKRKNLKYKSKKRNYNREEKMGDIQVTLLIGFLCLLVISGQKFLME